MKKKKYMFLIILCFICFLSFKNIARAQEENCDVNVYNIKNSSFDVAWKCKDTETKSGTSKDSVDEIVVYNYDVNKSDGKGVEFKKISTGDSDNKALGYTSVSGLSANKSYTADFKINKKNHVILKVTTAKNSSSKGTIQVISSTSYAKYNLNVTKDSINQSKNNGGTQNNSYVPLIEETDEKFCDDAMRALIRKYWNYIMLLAPILLIVLLTVDGIKCVSAGTADKIKKYGNDAVKRVIATLILLALPSLISMIMGWFGLSDMICF